jgi:hypothetical protein
MAGDFTCKSLSPMVGAVWQKMKKARQPKLAAPLRRSILTT